jgi:phosphoribosylformylglycinamidine synthase
VAILREQGVNSQVETAYGFDRAGFSAVDVHMSDLIAAARASRLPGLRRLRRLQLRRRAGRGRGLGDVGAGASGTARDVRGVLCAPGHRSQLGVCNGCQMLAQLKPIIPGADHWPRFLRNRSGTIRSPPGVAGSPETTVAVPAGHGRFAHTRWRWRTGEGRAAFANDGDAQSAVALRYVDGDGSPRLYPANPNGRPDAIAGLTTTDGRVTILMPHPERTLRTANYSWAPRDWADDGPWMRIFRNARKWVG